MYLFSFVLRSSCLIHAALPFFSVSFHSVRFGASNVLVLLRDCFVWLVRTLGFGCFLRRVFFFFYASFTYLELFYLRYFSFSVFLSTCLHLRYRNVFCRMRYSQLLHLMLQLVEGFGFPSILTWSTDNFRYIFLFSLHIVCLSLQ